MSGALSPRRRPTLQAQAASLRDAKDRLRAMEEQLLKSQTELAQVNSKVGPRHLVGGCAACHVMEPCIF